MASAGERLQKLSVEAFTRLRNDHEQFLEAYESELSQFSPPPALVEALFGGKNSRGGTLGKTTRPAAGGCRSSS